MRTPSVRLRFLLPFLLLTSCAAVETQTAESELPGMSRLDMETCAGIPTHKDAVQGAEIDTFVLQTKGDTLALPVPLVGNLGLNSQGSCTAVWRLRGDTVDHVDFTAATGGFGEPQSACAPLISGCLAYLHQQGKTPLPTPEFAPMMLHRRDRD